MIPELCSLRVGVVFTLLGENLART